MSSAYHPESDGSTEQVNRTMKQMISMSISPSQRDWVPRLPAIEFAINAARSEVTGYAPFFLNYGRIPRSFVWNNPSKDEFLGVRTFANRIKTAVMSAQDSIIAHRVKETRAANRRRIASPFSVNDLVYISTKNMSVTKGLTRKFTPRFVGSYKILRDFGNNSYEIEISPEMKRRGIHNVFHSSLLRIHVPNNDRLFPGRTFEQVWEMEGENQEWAVKKILSHSGSGHHALSEVKWHSGDVTWLPYHQISHLVALEHYLVLLGVSDISGLKDNGKVPNDVDDQILLGMVEFENESGPCNTLQDYKTRQKVFSILLGAIHSFELRPHISPKEYLHSPMPYPHPKPPGPVQSTEPWKPLPPAVVHASNLRRIHVDLPRGVVINLDLPSLLIVHPTYWRWNFGRDGNNKIIWRCVTPSLIREYLVFSTSLRTDPDIYHFGAPVGYEAYSVMFNLQDIPHKLVEWDPVAMDYFWPNGGIPVEKDIFNLEPYGHSIPPVIDEKLVAFELMDIYGNFNVDKIIRFANRLLDGPVTSPTPTTLPPSQSDAHSRSYRRKDFRKSLDSNPLTRKPIKKVVVKNANLRIRQSDQLYSPAISVVSASSYNSAHSTIPVPQQSFPTAGNALGINPAEDNTSPNNNDVTMATPRTTVTGIHQATTRVDGNENASPTIIVNLPNDAPSLAPITITNSGVHPPHAPVLEGDNNGHLTTTITDTRANPAITPAGVLSLAESSGTTNGVSDSQDKSAGHQDEAPITINPAELLGGNAYTDGPDDADRTIVPPLEEQLMDYEA